MIIIVTLIVLIIVMIVQFCDRSTSCVGRDSGDHNPQTCDNGPATTPDKRSLRRHREGETKKPAQKKTTKKHIRPKKITV